MVVFCKGFMADEEIRGVYKCISCKCVMLTCTTFSYRLCSRPSLLILHLPTFPGVLQAPLAAKKSKVLEAHGVTRTDDYFWWVAAACGCQLFEDGLVDEEVDR